MKSFSMIEKFFSPAVLVVLNIAIILIVEYAGGGRYFAETGLVHAIAIVFVVLIIARIFSDYEHSYKEIKGFLVVQLAAFFLLGIVHVYEYLGLHVLNLNSSVVELSVVMSYMIWFLCLLLSLELVSRAYYGGRGIVMWMLIAIISLVSLVLIGINISSSLVSYLPSAIGQMMLVFMVALAIMEVSSLAGVKQVLPVFFGFSNYSIPATMLLFVSAFFEYIESSGILSLFRMPDTQITYISHFLIYAVLSLLFVAIGKLKIPGTQ